MLEAGVAALIMGISLSAAARLYIGKAQQTFSLDHKAQADQLLVNSATKIQRGSYEQLHGLCLAAGAYTATPPSRCVDSQNKFAPQGNPDPDQNVYSLDVGIDYNGDPIAGGPACVEIQTCSVLSPGRLISVLLRVHWNNPNGVSSNTLVHTAVVEVRKGRW